MQIQVHNYTNFAKKYEKESIPKTIFITFYYFSSNEENTNVDVSSK